MEDHQYQSHVVPYSAYDTKFFIGLFGGALKVVRSGVYFVVMAFLFAELFGILVYAGWMTCDVTLWTHNDVKLQNMEYLCKYLVYRL